MKYLKDSIKTLEELKKEYRRMALKLHPDVGGSNEDMKELNAEYDIMFKKVSSVHMNMEGKFYEKETEETPNEFIDLIEKLIHMDGIEIEIIGCFVWVSGDTKPHKDDLKALGFRWHNKKKCWYKAPKDYRPRSRRDYSMDEIREMYGDIKVSKNDFEKKPNSDKKKSPRGLNPVLV